MRYLIAGTFLALCADGAYADTNCSQTAEVYSCENRNDGGATLPPGWSPKQKIIWNRGDSNSSINNVTFFYDLSGNSTDRMIRVCLNKKPGATKLPDTELHAEKDGQGPHVGLSKSVCDNIVVGAGPHSFQRKDNGHDMIITWRFID